MNIAGIAALVRRLLVRVGCPVKDYLRPCKVSCLGLFSLLPPHRRIGCFKTAPWGEACLASESFAAADSTMGRQAVGLLSHVCLPLRELNEYSRYHDPAWGDIVVIGIGMPLRMS